MRTLLLVPALALAAACAPASAGSGPAAGAAPADSSAPRSRRADPNILTQQEIAEVSVGNAFDLVRARRPRWLSASGATVTRNPGGNPLVVYMNRTRLGGAEALRSISASGVASMRYYDPTAANIEFGNGHLGGVIQVLPAGSGAAGSRP